MSAVDKFYTPLEVARKMISAAGNIRPRYIADFTAGNGDLLSVAHEKWGKSQIIAADICHDSVKYLKKRHPSWMVSQCDFLIPEDRNNSRTLREVEGSVSLILLNPPFSCRGGSRKNITINGQSIWCSTALAFILTSIPFLSNKGQIIAVLPAGSLSSEKDAVVWNILARFGRVDILDRNGHRTFHGCSAKTLIMRFQRNATNKVQDTSEEACNNAFSDNKIRIKIVRGSVQMHSLNGTPIEQTLPLIHSTDLKGHAIDLTQHRAEARYRSVTGPNLLIPRVGKPSKNKLSIYNSRTPVLLSDCVIALNCRTSKEMKKAKAILEDNWSKIIEAYGGTCAAFVTIKAISRLLRYLGFRVVNAS